MNDSVWTSSEMTARAPGHHRATRRRSGRSQVTASYRGIAPRFRHQILLPWTAELAPFYEGSTRFGDDRLQRTYGAGAGWHYLIRRFHDPATGQFLSVAGRVHCTAICRSDISSVEPRELGELDRTM